MDLAASLATRVASDAAKCKLPPVRRVIVIQNEQGLHAHPAEKFVRLAPQFEAKIELIRDGRRVEARNIIDLLTLGAAKGTELILEAEGRDAQAAVDALAKLVESGFPEDENNDQRREEKSSE